MVAFYRVIGSFAGISMIGSLLIIITFFLVKDVRKHPTSLVFFLSVADFFFSSKFLITSIVPDSDSLQNSSKAWCILQGIFGQFFGLSSIGWIGMISINLVLNLRNPFANTAKYAIWYHLWVWGYSLVTTILLIALNDVGPAGDGTCWIKQDEAEGRTNLMVLTFLIPLLAYFIIAIIALIYAQARSQDSFEGQTKMARSIMLRMRIFVFVFIFLWSGSIAHRIAQIWWTDDEGPPGLSNTLKWWEGVSSSTQGFFNSVIWLSHPVVFRSFRGALQKMGCCWKATADRVPLLGRIQSELEEQEDIQRMDVLMRKSIVTCILLGLKKSLKSRGSSLTNHYEDYREVYSTKKSKLEKTSSATDLLAQELSSSTVNELEQVRLNYLFKDFEPVLFEELRERDGITNQLYLEALQPERFLGNLKNQSFSEGRSGSFFCFSPDKNFIIKTIEEHEANILKALVPSFCEHFKKYPNSMLNKLYGFHSVKIHQLRIFVIVMGNVFNTKKKIHERYDLKFSWIQRYSKAHRDNPSSLGKDLNLQHSKRKLKLTPIQRDELLKQIEVDAKFLCSHGIMDYSLLVGFHFHNQVPRSEVKISINSTDYELGTRQFDKTPGGGELTKALENKGILSSDGEETYFIGVIDILQAYNFNKKMERFIKVHLLKQDKLGLSVQPVDVYCERFISRPQFIIETSL